MPHYAWSPIKGGTAEQNQQDKPVTVARGDAVTQADLGVSDADWQAMIDAGSIREKKFPAPADFDGSVIDYLREKLSEAQSMSAVDEEEAASELAQIQNAATASGELPEPAGSEAKDAEAKSSTTAKK